MQKCCNFDIKIDQKIAQIKKKLTLIQLIKKLNAEMLRFQHKNR